QFRLAHLSTGVPGLYRPRQDGATDSGHRRCRRIRGQLPPGAAAWFYGNELLPDADVGDKLKKVDLCRMAFSNDIIAWYNQHKRDLPWRHTTDPYVIWLSEIILQQTRVEQGLPYFDRFLAH